MLIEYIDGQMHQSVNPSASSDPTNQESTDAPMSPLVNAAASDWPINQAIDR